jgi:uncharacterized coiled-coil protein SlyX
MGRTRVSSIFLDNDVLEWLEETGRTFGENRSEKIRTVMRAGYSQLKREHPDAIQNPLETDPPDYDIRLLIRDQTSLNGEIDRLGKRYKSQVDRITGLSRQLSDLRRLIRDTQDE